MIEQKGMTFDHDFGYSFPLFLFPPKKRGKKKRRMYSTNREQKLKSSKALMFKKKS
jgi:hypothetical protein